MAERRSHDFRLLDALGERDGERFDATVWRVVRQGRSVLDGSRGAGRWNPRDLSVLYAAKEPNGALAEIHHHLSLGQSVFPSRIRHQLFELKVSIENVLVLPTLTELAKLGVDESRYSELLYDRCQEIADAAAFLGFSGLVTPSARWGCHNVVLFLDAVSMDDINVVSETSVNWRNWIDEHRGPMSG